MLIIFQMQKRVWNILGKYGLDNGNKMETICGILVAKKMCINLKTCFTTIKAYSVKWYEKKLHDNFKGN